MIEFIVANFYPISGAILLACFVGYINWRNNFKVRQANAASVFRAAIDPNIAIRSNGHALHQALLGNRSYTGIIVEGAYFKHRRAFVEFKCFLGPVGRWRINKAWREYTGNNDDTPDFFAMYCVGTRQKGENHTDKQILLKKRLEKLHDVSATWY